MENILQPFSKDTALRKHQASEGMGFFGAVLEMDLSLIHI